jgi:hypothetical protein
MGDGYNAYMNYTKRHSYNGAIWQTYDDNGLRNITIPKACFKAFHNKIVLHTRGNEEASSHYYCHNGREFAEIGYYVGGNMFYEEGIYWR